MKMHTWMMVLTLWLHWVFDPTNDQIIKEVKKCNAYHKEKK